MNNHTLENYDNKPTDMGVEDIIYDEIIDSMTGGDILSVGLSEKKIMAHL